VWITFERMADRRPVETVVERDDGVVYAMRAAGGGPDLPHDLVHALVELELGVTDGIWGAVADGVVWGSMRHVFGRRPPHAAERSVRLQKERGDRIMAAEHLADVVRRLSRGEPVSRDAMSRSPYPRDALERAARALTAAEARWASLTPGEQWVVSWPAAGRSSAGRSRGGRGRRGRG
jgi:hypothetical protein